MEPNRTPKMARDGGRSHKGIQTWKPLKAKIVVTNKGPVTQGSGIFAHANNIAPAKPITSVNRQTRQ